MKKITNTKILTFIVLALLLLFTACNNSDFAYSDLSADATPPSIIQSTNGVIEIVGLDNENDSIPTASPDAIAAYTTPTPAIETIAPTMEPTPNPSIAPSSAPYETPAPEATPDIIAISPSTPTPPPATVAPTVYPTATPAPTIQPTPAPTAQPTPAPTATPAATLNRYPSLENQMLELVNQERAAEGLPALVMTDALRNVARIRADDMVVNDYFSHTNLEGQSPFDVMHENGITYTTAGENIAYSYSITAAHEALMDSPGHRANIMNANFGHIGIGVQKDSDGNYKIVQLFTN